MSDSAIDRGWDEYQRGVEGARAVAREAGWCPLLVCIGDSITFGEYVDPSQRWTSLLGPRWQVENRGVCRDTTRLGLERFPEDVQVLNPDIVLISFGLNDCNRWQTDRGLPRVSYDAFTANLAEMVTRARHFGAERVVLTTTTPTTNPAPFEADSDIYSEGIRMVAEQTQAELCDVRASFAGLMPVLEDGVHLTPEGHERYARCVQFVLGNER